MVDDDVQKMGHLMRRAGFGAGQDELGRRSRNGIAAATHDLLEEAAAPDDGKAEALLASLVARDRQQRLRPAMLKPWWLYRMVTTDYPLQEKLVLFWHGHFATSASKVNPPDLMLQQNRFFRENALGNWRTLLQGISRDAAMIKWLDNDQNAKAHPNENYARELMELFTLGIGNYTENDVKQSARAFTGWNTAGGNFNFQANRHDDGVKSFLGRTGNFDGDDIINIILEKPAASEFLTRKLFTYFAYSDPEPSVVATLARQFRESDYSIRTLVEAIFKSDAFWSRRAINTQIKSPAQLVVGSLRTLGAAQLGGLPGNAGGTLRPGRGIWFAAATALKQMGQDLFYPPNVKGWDGGPTWIDAATMLERINFATSLTTLAARGGRDAFSPLLGEAVDESPDKIVDRLLANLGPIQLPADARQAMMQPLEAGGAGAPGAFTNSRMTGIRTAVALAMQTPEYQLC